MTKVLGMIVGLAALVAATPALGQAWRTVTSPDGRITVDFGGGRGRSGVPRPL